MENAEDSFSIFKKYPTLELAQETASFLNEAGIQTIIADNVPPVDITFGGSTLQNEIEIRISPRDFKQAELLLQERAEKLIDEVDPSYYLFDFSDEELYDILLKPDEWGEFDYVLSQQILRKRGKTVDKELLASLKKKRIIELAAPEKSQKGWIIAGYIFSILGGFVGIVIGYALWKAKKTLPNGTKVYSYSEKDRKQGLNIFIIGLIIFPIALLLNTFPIFDY